VFGDATGAFIGDSNRLWREVKLIANGVQPEYVKRGGYLTASCKAKLKELEDVGVDQFNVYLMTHGQEETLQAYGDEIIPEFSGVTA